MADELQSYVNRVNPDETYTGKLEEAIRRALSENGIVVLDGDSDANIADNVMTKLLNSK